MAGDESKVGFLRNLAGAGARLSLFSADLYAAHTFAPAIHGCEFVFLVATPMQHDALYTSLSIFASSEIWPYLEYNYSALV